MSIQSVSDQITGLTASVGKRVANALFPNDVEIYIFALELVNSDEQTEDYFIFPVNPSSVSEQNTPIQSIKKTAGGFTVLNSTTFSPTTTSIQGSFGRKFKFLLEREVINFSALTLGTANNKSDSDFREFSKQIKSGYGCIKVLERIINKSNTVDSKKKPYALYFYNLALGNSYLIKVVNFNFYQNLETNIIWNYNLQFKSLIPIENLLKDSGSKLSLTQALAANGAIQQQVNIVGNGIRKIVSSL